MGTIRVKTVRRDGTEVALPVCQKARRFCQLVRKPYMTAEEIFIIRKIGVKVEIED